MKTGDHRLMPGQTKMMMRELGSGQKGASMALSGWSWLSMPHMCTAIVCQAVLADMSAVVQHSGPQLSIVTF